MKGQLAMVLSMKGWAMMAFAVVVLAMIGLIDIGTAFYAVIILTGAGIFFFQIPSVIPLLQFALSLLILIVLSGGVGAFGTALLASPVTAMLAP
ncbi:MAG: hypothetical protein KAT35_03240 [Candidatus Aenigmarchaeota archaeon]|nr:hypothetical protein [Candidatus Aenigmarchaeota archaeon]